MLQDLQIGRYTPPKPNTAEDVASAAILCMLVPRAMQVGHQAPLYADASTWGRVSSFCRTRMELCDRLAAFRA